MFFTELLVSVRRSINEVYEQIENVDNMYIKSREIRLEKFWQVFFPH